MPFDFSDVSFDTVDDDREKENLQSNLSEAIKINADQHAEQQQLSTDTGVPVFAVDESVKQKFTFDQIDFDGLTKNNPKTAKHLSNFDNSVVAQDDISVMQMIEDGFTSFNNAPSRLLKGSEEALENIGESIELGFEAQGKGFLLAGSDVGPDRIQDLIPYNPMMSGTERALLAEEYAKSFGIENDEQLRQAKQEGADNLIKQIQVIQEKQQNLTPEDMNIFQQGLRGGIESLANMAPGTALMLASGGRAAPMLSTIYLQTYSGSYGDARAEGLTPSESQWFANINAAIEVGTEVLPTGTIERILTGKSTGLKKEALKFMVQEMGTEQIATFGQSLNEYAFGLDKEMEQATSIEERIAIQARRQAVTAVATVVAGGAQITAATGVRKSVEAFTRDTTRKETKAEVEQNQIDSLNEQAQQSKLRERDKESFKQFVNEADGENNTHVFIDGAQTALYMQGKTPEEIKADPALQTLSDQVQEASEQGNDVQIPVADFAADFAGTEHFDALRDSMTMSDETIAPFRQEQVKQEQEAYINNLMDEDQKNTSEYVQAQEIFTQVRDQLVDTGAVTPANASVMARIVPAWATAQAARSGKTVEQVYRDAGLTIEGPQTGERARQEGEMILEQVEKPTAAAIDPAQAWQEHHAATAEASGLTPEQAEAVAPEPDTDPLTGLFTDTELLPAIERASASTEATQYVESDLFNLGGLNKALGANVRADAVLKQIADVYAEVFKTGSVFRRGAGRFAAIVLVDVDVNAAIEQLNTEVARIVEENNLTDIPAPKVPGETGIKLFSGMTNVEQGATLNDIIGEAQEQINAEIPQGETDVNREQAFQTWTATSSGQAEGIAARVAETSRAVEPEISRVEGKTTTEALERVGADTSATITEGNRAFATPAKTRRAEFEETAEAVGLTTGQAEPFRPTTHRDPLTGWFTDRDRIPTIERAQQQVEDTGVDAVYVVADISNLGGLNLALGEEVADVVFRNMAQIVGDKAAQIEGAESVPFRHGGDEISFVITGANQEVVQQAMDEAAAEVSGYAEAIGIQDLPHAKAVTDKSRRGSGVYIGTQVIEGVDSDINDTVDGADALVELNKTQPLAEATPVEVRGEGVQFAQETIGDKDLFVAHNLSAENLIHAADVGGLAVPSLAIARTDTGFEAFGEISLLADKALLQDPAAKTFGADIYSPRYPSVVYKIDNKEYDKAIEPINEKLQSIGIDIVRTDIESRGIQELFYDTGIRYSYLESIDKAPKLKYRKKEKFPAAFKKFPGTDQHNISRDSKFKEAAADYYRKKAEMRARAMAKAGKDAAEAAEEGFEGNEYEYWLKDWTDTYFNEEGEVYLRFIDELAYDVAQYNKPRQVDTYELDRQLSSKLKTAKAEGEFKAWIEEKFDNVIAEERIFTGYTPSGNRKYIAHNLDNVVKIMKKELRGGENFNYGVGTIRSGAAPQFRTIKQIQKARGRLTDKTTMDALKEETSNEFTDLVESMRPYYKYDGNGFGYLDAASENLYEMARGKGLQDYENLPDDIRTEAAEFLAKLRDMPTEYFESKVQRAVGLEEFDTAIVPKGTRKDALQVLKDSGLKVKTYDPKVEGSRADIIAKQKQLLFQKDKEQEARGYYDPANSVIRLTEAADLSTFLHEFAHFMYEMEVNGNTEMLQSINSWYKRNAENVAKEANSYLGAEFDTLKQGEITIDELEQKWSKERFDRIKKAQKESIDYKDLENPDEIIFDHSDDVEAYLTKDLGLYIDTDVSGYGSRYINIYESVDNFEDGVEPVVIRFGTHSTPSNYIGVGGHKLPDYDIRNSDQILTVLDDIKSKFSISEQFAQPTDKITAKEGSITPEDVIAFLDNTTTGDKAKNAAIRRAVHEQFARGFEAYLMEGKAPSIELRNAFRTFARWLVRIYQSLKGQLNVNIDAEMRAVFDRLIATEDQIAAAEGRAQVEPMFTDAAMAGMTEEEFADYQKRQEKVKDVQSETLRDKIIKQLTRQTKKWWKEEKNDIIDEQIEVLKKERVYRAREQLKVGELKIDHATVKEMAGEEKVDKIGRTSVVIPPSLKDMTAKGQKGVHPDEAAAFLGYDSGSEMIADLTTAPAIKDQAETNADAAMVDRHGDIFTDGTIEQQADEAVQNEERGKLILHELKMLAKGTNAPTIDRATIKDLAITNIGKLSFREIHPAKYRKAEIRAAQEAAVALKEGNKELAAEAKLRQVMNYYLGMEAMTAKNETTKIIDRMARYNKKKVREEIIKAENGYWDQITNILSRFEFRKAASLKDVDSINLWAKERMESDGDGLILTNAVLNESYVTHWKNVPFTDLQGINDSVKNIEHVARYANKIKLQQEEIDFKKLKTNWVDHINEQDQRFETKASRSRIDDTRKATAMEHVRKWASQLTKVPFLASWLDGGERAGMSHDILVQQFTDALDDKMKMVDEVATPVLTAIDSRSKDDKKRHNTKIWIPEIEDHLMGHQVLAVALNAGNQGNLKKMLLGEGWADPEVETDISIDNPQLQAVLKHMTKNDWELVQKIWDQMDLLYPQLADVHRRTTGLTPPKVEATPIETEFGTFRGGYYPVKYSPKRSYKAEKNAEKREAETESMFNNTASIQSSVNAGATNERTGFYDRINLSLEVVPDHFNETIHYITHHDAVRQVNRLIQAPDVADAISGVLGEEEFKQLKPWLNDVAKDGRQQPVKTYIDSIFQRLRFGTTLGIMGFKASTGIMQLFGIFTTAAELGTGPTIKGIYTTVGRSWYMKAIRNTLGSTDAMQTGWEFAAEKSKVMNHRVKTMDREIKNAMDRLRGKTGFLASVQEASMKHIALIQTYMIDLPTWHAAYSKELSESGDEIKAVNYADWAVENLQGSGATKDMATILRSQSKLHTTMTMFMTFFSSLGNLSRDVVKGSRSGLYSSSSVAAKLMFLFTLPVFFEMLMRGELDEPEGEDDRLSKFLTANALYPLTSIPFVRDAASAVIGDYGYNSSPVASVIEKGLQGIKQIKDRAFTDDEITTNAKKNASKLAGVVLTIPGVSQAWSTGEHLYDVMEEGEEFTVRELLFGPDR